MRSRGFRRRAAFVRRLGQVSEALRQRDVVIGKVFLVVVQRHVAEIDGQQAVAGIQLQIGGNAGQCGRVVGLEDVGRQRTTQETVVHAVEHVGQRIVLAQDRLVQRQPGVAGLQELHLAVALFLEFRHHRFAHAEAVVGHHRQRACAGRGGRGDDGRLRRRRRGGRSRNGGVDVGVTVTQPASRKSSRPIVQMIFRYMICLRFTVTRL